MSDKGWISVEDKLPFKYQEVFVWPYPTGMIMTAALGVHGWEYYEYNTGFGYDILTMHPPTHWRPLFAPPENSS